MPPCLAVGLCLILAGVSCGKKGPPLPPLVTLPAAPEDLTARRLGSAVVLQFKVPANNTDGVRPADLARVEVYAHSGPLKTPADYLDEGTVVGMVNVMPPPPAEDEGSPAPPRPPGVVDQGAVASISEALPRPELQATASPGGTAPGPPMRYYTAVGVNRRGRRGPVSQVVAVPLVEPPAAPSGVDAKTESQWISVGWAPAGTSDPSESPVTYNVYLAPGAIADTAATVPSGAPAPLNTEPVSELLFKHANSEWGRERCYVVRTVATVAAARIESEPSAPACVTPVDVFPPAAPGALAAVGSADSISLIWEANTENDLAGYLVLRGEAPGEKLAPLTPTPIRDTTYRDSTAKRGVSYVYAVRAVDNAAPANVSESSNLVTEVVR